MSAWRVQALIGVTLLLACGRFHFDPVSGSDGGSSGDVSDTGAVGDVGPLPTTPWGNLMTIALGIGGDDPSMTGDGLEIYINNGSSVYGATRATTSDPWNPATLVTSLPSGMYSPHLSFDGLTLWAASTSPTPSHIVYTTRTARTDTWGPIQTIPEITNPAGDDAPSVSSDGLTMVFDSYRNGGTVFLSTRQTTASAWSTPVEISELNVAGFAGRPHLTDDGLQIYFQGPGTTYDKVWMATRASRTVPFDPPHVVEELVTIGEEDPWVSADGHVLLFFGISPGPTGAVWQATR